MTYPDRGDRVVIVISRNCSGLTIAARLEAEGMCALLVWTAAAIGKFDLLPNHAGATRHRGRQRRRWASSSATPPGVQQRRAHHGQEHLAGDLRLGGDGPIGAGDEAARAVGGMAGSVPSPLNPPPTAWLARRAPGRPPRSASLPSIRRPRSPWLRRASISQA